MTLTQLCVLNAFPPPPPEETWALELCDATKLSAGTVYPALANLERGGLIESRWAPTARGIPRRRMYRLTSTGLRERFERREGVGGARLAAEGA